MGPNMRGKAKKKQSKFMRCIIRAAIRILTKARDLYVKSLLDCADKTGCNNVVCPVPHIPSQLLLPRNSLVSVVGSSNDEINNEDLRKLVRVVSKRSTGQAAKGQRDGVGRSYSVGIGKIGRIDEDEPCEFEEGVGVGEGNNGDLLCPRSKSYAVRRRNIVYY